MMPHEFEVNVRYACQVTPFRAHRKRQVSEMRMRQRRRYFPLIAIFKLPLSKNKQQFTLFDLAVCLGAELSA